MDQTTAPPSEWKLLLGSLWERFWKPYSRPAAVMYLLLAVVGMGGLSTWVTFAFFHAGQTTPRDLAISIGTYVVAVTCTAVADLILEVGPTNLLKFILFSLSMISITLVGYLTFHFVFSAKNGAISFWRLLECVSPMWALWWLTNGSDRRFISYSDPTIAAGGDPNRAL